MKLLFGLCLSICLVGCSSTVKTKDVTGTAFPSVTGKNLANETINLPSKYLGRSAIYLVGYKQKTQFDIDRWILGLLQLGVNAAIVEVPTVEGMLPQAVQGFISGGMRSGIPEEDWASVVTVFEDADKIIESFGNERPQSAYVFLVDSKGKIAWSTNRGYSASQVLEVSKVLQAIENMK